MKPFDAPGYQQARGNYNAEDEKELMFLLKGYDGKRILDVGCGDGAYTKKAKRALPDARIDGIDSSPEQIAFAVQDPQGVTFTHIAIADFIAPHDYDCAFSLYAFPHIPKSELSKSLRSVHSCLRHSGYFFLYTNICDFEVQDVPANDQEACDIYFKEMDWASEINLSTIREYESCFSQVGFTLLANKKQQDGISVKNYGTMYSWSFILKKI